MSELRMDRQVRDDAHRQPDGFALFARTQPSNAAASPVVVSPPKHSAGTDPAKRLEHCISLQAMAISLSEGERRAPLAMYLLLK